MYPTSQSEQVNTVVELLNPILQSEHWLAEVHTAQLVGHYSQAVELIKKPLIQESQTFEVLALLKGVLQAVQTVEELQVAQLLGQARQTPVESL